MPIVAAVPTNGEDERLHTKELKSDWKKGLTRAKNRETNSARYSRFKTFVVTSYANILIQVKRDPNLNVLGENIKNIRNTEKRELLFELNRAAHENTNQLD